MNDQYVYLCVDLCCIIVPLLASFHPRIQFYMVWKVALPVTVFVAAVFVSWDVFFTARGIWSFNHHYVLGYYFMGLPVEELLFFICIPYACTFTYYCFSLLQKIPQYFRGQNAITWLLALVCLAIGMVNYGRWYTFTAFTFLSLMLAITVVFQKSILPVFYLSFLVTLLPFFISNGILTGTGLDEPVVRYNNRHNLNIRLLTIPVEDVFYGMLLQLGNVFLFRYFTRRNPVRRDTIASMNQVHD